MNLKFLFLMPAILLLNLSVALASDEGPSSEITVVGITQFTQPALGIDGFGTIPMMQSSKNSFGGSIEYTHWLGSNGFAATYSVVASDANFRALPSGATMQALQFPLTRHEVSGSYIRKLFPYSRLDPYLEIGAGEFFTHGQLGARINGAWISEGYLGIDCQFELTSGAGFDLWRTRHFGIRTGYTIHWFRAPNFSDPSYRGSRTFITEPEIGFTWSF